MFAALPFSVHASATLTAPATRCCAHFTECSAVRDALITVVYRKSTTVRYCIKRYGELLNY